MTINLKTYSGHFGSVRSISFDPFKEKIISIGTDDGRLFIWNVDGLSPSTSSNIENKTGEINVRAVTWLGDSEFFYGGDDKKITKTDWPECREYEIEVDSENEIFFASSKWDNFCIAYSDQHMINFVDRVRTVYDPIHIDGEIIWLKYSPNARFLAVCCSDSTIIVWEANKFTEKFRRVFNLGGCLPVWGPGDILFVPDSSTPGKFIFIHCENLEEHEILNELQEAPTQAVALSNDLMLAVCDNSHKVYFLRINDDFSVSPFSTAKYDENEDLTSLDWGYNYLAAGGSEGTLFLWELTDQDEQKQKSKPVEIEENVENETEKTEKAEKQGNNKNTLANDNKTLDSVLLSKDRGITTIKPRKTTKKAKSKGKQQTLNLMRSTDQQSTKTEKKRRFIPDVNSSESESSDDPIEGIDIPEETPAEKSFLDDDNDDDDPLIDDPIEKPNDKSFLDDDLDNVDIDAIEKTNSTKGSFLNDEENEDVDPDAIDSNHSKDSSKSFLENNNVPDYDDIALPDDEEYEALVNENQNNTINIPSDGNDGDERESFYHEYAPAPIMTTEFMPGSCSEPNGNAKILCWNSEGSVIFYTDETNNEKKTVEIRPYGESSFYVKQLHDAHEIKLGTVDANGYMVATSQTVVYHKHNSYGKEAEIILNFPIIEDVKMIACGETFLAVATSQNYLHLFATSGFQLSVFSLNGKIISMIGHKNYLFVVSGNFRFELFDVFNHTSLAKGYLPIHSPLKYIGFNHYDDSVVIVGGNDQILSLSYSNGIRWTPVLDFRSYFGSSYGKPNGKTFFIVDVYGNQVSGVLLENGVHSPETPLPEELYDIDFDPPTIDSQLNKCMVAILNYQHAVDKEKEAKNFDKELLKEFNSALEQNKLLLSFQIAKQLKTSKGVDLAIRICDQRGQPRVAERLNKLKDSKFNDEYDDESSSADFEINESTDEPEPFKRKGDINNEEEEEENEDKPMPEIFRKKEKEGNHKAIQNEEEEEETSEAGIVEEDEEANEDADDLVEQDLLSNNTGSETSGHMSHASSLSNKEKQKNINKKKAGKHIPTESESESESNKDEDDDNEDRTNESDDDNDNGKKHKWKQSKSKKSSKEKSSKEKTEKQKEKEKEKNKEVPKKKSTRKKLFTRTDKPTSVSVLDRFGFK